MTSDDERDLLSGNESEGEDAELSDEEEETQVGSKRSFLSRVPKVRYGDMVERQERMHRELQEESLDDSHRTTQPPKKRRKSGKEELPPLVEEPGEDNVDEFIEKQNASDRHLRTQMWYGYVRLCQAADSMMGEPSSFPQAVAESKDIKDSFDLAIESGSLGEYVKDVDPMMLLLFSTAMLCVSCRKQSNPQSTPKQLGTTVHANGVDIHPIEVPAKGPPPPQRQQQQAAPSGRPPQGGNGGKEFDFDALFA